MLLGVILNNMSLDVLVISNENSPYSNLHNTEVSKTFFCIY